MLMHHELETGRVI